MSKEIIRPGQFAKADQVDSLQFSLSEEQKKAIEELYSEVSGQFSTGQLFMGKIINIDSSGVLVDIEYKSNGLIPSYEFSDHELTDLAVGSEIEVIIDELENLNGEVVLSYEKAKALKAWERITKLHEEGKPVEGFVSHKVKGGLSVDIGIPAFLPGSQVDLHRVTDFDQFVGQKITAEIIKVNRKRGNIIISRRKYLAERRDESRKEILESLEADKVITGNVKNITNYGVFIDIGGVDGLLHITDMTWGRISHPSEIVKIGDSLSVKVLSVDKENYKVSLGMKQLDENPWKELDKDVKVGARIKGKIASITDYGLFVEIQKGVEGLVHISEISWTDRIADLRDRYDVGQEIEVLVVSLDEENRRMSLSIKQLERNPWATVLEDFKADQAIEGVVTNVTDFGIFIQLVPGVDGLAHVSDLSWTDHIENPSNLYKKGDKVKAKILSIDEESKKVALGIKQLAQDPWTEVFEKYPVGTLVKATVTRIVGYGAFARLDNGIEGLIHASEFADRKEDPVEVGQERELRVVNVNLEERKITLSLFLEDRREARAEKRRTDRESASRSEMKSMSSSGPKAKTALQLELEKLAGNKSNDDTDNE